MKTQVLFLTILWLLASTTAAAQFTVEASVTSMFDDNINNNCFHVSDKITSVDLKSAHDWETETSNVQLFYGGSLNYFSSITDRTFQTHTFGVTCSHLIHEESQTLLNTGATYSLRLGRGEYTFYDNKQFSAYANIKHSFSERFMGRLSMNVRSIGFSELTAFDYTELYGFVQTTMFLPTHTTLILEADLGTKIYTAPNADSLATSSNQGAGWRRVDDVASPSATQLIGLTRIGQPLAEGTGLSLTASYQLSLRKESRYLTSDVGVVSDDELFDDHYGYEGWHAGLMLTQLLRAETTLRLSGSIQDRTYTGRPAYDLAGTLVAPTRIDTRKTISVFLEKRFDSAGLSLGLAYDYIVNASNDLFYDYTNNALTMRFSYSY